MWKRKPILMEGAVDDKTGAGGGAAGGAGGAAAGGAGSGGAGAGASAGAAQGGAGGAAAGAAGAGGTGASADPGAFGDWGKITEAYDKARNGEGKHKGVLGRYTDFGAFADAHLSLQNKISKGEFRSTVKPDPAKVEEMVKWRAENGVPEAPDKYDIKLSGDRKVLKEDKAYIDTILAKVHGQNVNSQVASAVVETYYDLQTQMKNDRQAQDTAIRAATEHALRVEWGGNYEPFNNDINAFVDMAPKDVRDRLRGGRLADGTPIMEDAATKRWLLATARAINPVSSVVPLGNADQMSGAIESELTQIKKDMGAKKGSDAWKSYWKDDARQARYRDLLDAQAKGQQAGKKT